MVFELSYQNVGIATILQDIEWNKIKESRQDVHIWDRSASKTEKAVYSGAQLVVKCLRETAFSVRLKDWN